STYAAPAGSTGRSSGPSSTGSAGSSRQIAGIPSNRSRRERTVTAAVIPASSSTNRTRAAGYDGSTGTYAAPVSRMPTSAAIEDAVRGRQTATRSSTSTPSASSRRASARASATSSAYVV